MSTLNETLIYSTRRRGRPGGLTPDQRVAVNLFWRKRVRAVILARVFNVSPNTIYYAALTGEADSYPTSMQRNSAAKVNDLIEEIGEEEAWRRFVTDDMINEVNAEMARDLAERQSRS